MVWKVIKQTSFFVLGYTKISSWLWVNYAILFIDFSQKNSRNTFLYLLSTMKHKQQCIDILFTFLTGPRLQAQPVFAAVETGRQ